MNFIDSTDEQIIQRLCEGTPIKAICKYVDLSTRQIEDRLVRMRARNNCVTTTQLVAKYVACDKEKLHKRFIKEIFPQILDAAQRYKRNSIARSRKSRL